MIAGLGSVGSFVVEASQQTNSPDIVRSCELPQGIFLTVLKIPRVGALPGLYIGEALHF